LRLVPDNIWAILTIKAEAGGEPFAGKVGVAEVIRNRAAHQYNSDGTIPGTVLKRWQFSCWNTDDQNRIRVAMSDSEEFVVKDCAKAWQKALNGSNTVHGAVLYFNPGILARDPEWVAACEQVAQIGNHRFFVEKARG